MYRMWIKFLGDLLDAFGLLVQLMANLLWWLED
jgi:hypothetical protein